MNKHVRSFVLWLFATAAIYFCGAFTLYVMTLFFGAEFESIWTAAVPVMILSELILLAWRVCRKYKDKKATGENKI